VSSWFDYNINGLVVGNIYALLAVAACADSGRSPTDKLRSRLVYTGACLCRMVCITYLNTPLPIGRL